MLALLAGLTSFAALAQVTGDPAKGADVAGKLCVACHGADGNSLVPNFPKLAGQHAEYLLKQLQDFKSKRRQTETMAPQIAELSADDMANLAAHFARQKSAPGAAKDPKLAAAGKKLYDNGNPASGVAACGSCHGAGGAGSAQYPRLAGQHAEYATAELKAYAAGKRKNDQQVMRAIAAQMTEQEIAAVAQYIASLP